MSGYTFTYLGSQTERSAQKRTVKARVRITKDGSDLGVYAPAISSFPNFDGGVGHAVGEDRASSATST